jgi:hypothetical protein
MMNDEEMGNISIFAEKIPEEALRWSFKGG